jgi:AAA ATPase domain
MHINWFRIKNFRSLRDVTISGLATSVVFHGPNDSGKSNILLALEKIFKRKLARADVGLPEGVSPEAPPARSTPFWHGVIPDFGDNFYMGLADPIEFHIRLEVPPNQLADVTEKPWLDVFTEAGHNLRVELEGRIERSGNDGRMVLVRFLLNKKPAAIRDGENIEWFPKLKTDEATKHRLGETLLDKLSDSVAVIPASRYLTSETIRDDPPHLNSLHFKNWLHSQSLSRDGFSTFQTVREWFNEGPLGLGEISFLRDGTALEIMVDDGYRYRMPIGSKGSGVQQILVLLGFIATCHASVIGIEEPELNLSFRNQDILVTKVRSLVNKANAPPYQLLLTSHSDHIGSRGDLKRFHVENQVNVGTVVRAFTSADRSNLFPRSPYRRKV